MASVENKRKRLVIHLYKHYDTRRYLNLDDAGHAYEFFYYDDERDDLDRDRQPGFSGRYRLHRTLEGALHRLGLWQFEYGRLSRSFPPSEWPADPDDLASAPTWTAIATRGSKPAVLAEPCGDDLRGCAAEL